MRPPVSLAPRALALAFLCAAAVVACKKEPEKKEGPHTTIAEDAEEKRLGDQDDDALLTRARKSPECGVIEPMPCDDPHIIAVRCELALRALAKRSLFEALLKDAKGTDRVRRSAALRIVTDLRDDAAAGAVHDALMDKDPTIACRAASYGIWFRRGDAPRLRELAKTCDGGAVISATAEAIEKGQAGALVQGGATCAEIRRAAR